MVGAAGLCSRRHTAIEALSRYPEGIDAAWLETIDLLATGRESEVVLYHGEGNAIPGTEYFADALKDTLGLVKGRLSPP